LKRPPAFRTGIPETRKKPSTIWPFPVAAALLDGEVGPDQVLPPRLHDPELLSLLDRVSTEIDPEFEAEFPAKAPAEVIVETTAGAVYRSGRIEALWEPPDSLPSDVNWKRSSSGWSGRSSVKQKLKTWLNRSGRPINGKPLPPSSKDAVYERLHLPDRSGFIGCQNQPCPNHRNDSCRQEKNADLVVFPELSLTGYFVRERYHEAALRMDSTEIQQLAKATKGTAAVVGFIEESRAMNFYNSALVAVDGEILFSYRKLNLPNYGVFEERKIFANRQTGPGVQTQRPDRRTVHLQRHVASVVALPGHYTESRRLHHDVQLLAGIHGR
jgi:hypothetical protein